MYNFTPEAGGRSTCSHPERKSLTNIIGTSNSTPVWCPLRVEAVEEKLIELRAARSRDDT